MGRGISITIGPESFDSKAAAKRRLRGLKDQILYERMGQVPEDVEPLLEGLRDIHPDPDKLADVEPISHWEVREHPDWPKGRCFWAIGEGGLEEDISVHKAIDEYKKGVSDDT